MAPAAESGASSSASTFWRNTALLIQKNLLLRKNGLATTILGFIVPLAFSAFIITFWTLLRRNPNYYGVGQSNAITATGGLSLASYISASERFYYVDLTNTNASSSNVTRIINYLVPQPEYAGTTVAQLKSKCASSTCWAGLVFNQVGKGVVNYTIRMPNGKFLMDEDATVNIQNGASAYGNSGFFALQIAVDLAITSLAAGRNVASNDLLVNATQFTKHTDAQISTILNSVFYAFMVSAGSTILVLVFVSFVFMMVNDLVMEKETKIKEGMMMMGLTHGVYYLSWVVTAALFNVVPWLGVVIIAHFTFFPATNFFLLWVLFFLTGLSCISLSFVFVPFFNRARVAGLVSGVIVALFGAIAPVVQAYASGSAVGSTTFTGGWRYVLALLSPTALVFGCMIISQLELMGVGVTWDNVWLPIVETGNMTFGGILLMITGDIFVYIVLAWYLAQVVPSEYGTTRPFYFLLTPSYWRGEGKEDSGSDTPMRDAKPNGTVLEVPDEPLEIGVSIQELVKKFKKQGSSGWHFAVDHLTLDIYKGQVLSLLGHNGAGKTTTMGMLTGLLPVSEGDALIDNKSVRTQMAAVRRSLGVCPQHDILWDKLTVRQTLRLYAGLKGIPWKEIDAAVDHIIAEVGMTEKSGVFTASLSGGQKRKVCIAIAFLGNSKVVFLDEPTSGMDPFSRRAVWDLVTKMRPGRTIVLTTHFMDEADILGDRIAIMSRGAARCAGSSLFLKSRFGIGYTLTLVKDLKAASVNTMLLDKLVLTIVDGAIYGFDSGSEIVYRLPMNSSYQFAELFRELEQVKVDAGITSYGVSVTSLEEVFLRIADDNKIEQGKAAEDNLDLGRSEAERTFGVTIARRQPSVGPEVIQAWRDDRSGTHPVEPADPGDSKKRKKHDKKGRSSKKTVEVKAAPSTSGPALVHSISKPVVDLDGPEYHPAASGGMSFWQQLHAQLLKRAWVAARDWKSSVMQVLVPLVLVMIACLIAMDYNSDCDFGTLDRSLPLTFAPQPSVPIPSVSGNFLKYAYGNSIPLANYDSSASLLLALSQSYTAYGTNLTAGFIGTSADARLTEFPSYTALFDAEPVQPATTTINGPSVINMINNAIFNSIRNITPPSTGKYTQSIAANVVLYGDAPTVTTSGAASNGMFSAFVLVLLVGYGYFPAASAAFIIKERITNAKHQQRVSGASALVYWLSAMLWDLIPALLVVAGTIPMLLIMRSKGPSGFVWYDHFAPDNIMLIGPVVLFLVLYVFACIPHVYCMTFLFSSYGAGFGGILGFYAMFGFMHISAFMGLYMSGNKVVAQYVSIPFMLLCPPAGLSKGLMIIGNFVSLNCDSENPGSYLPLFSIGQLGIPLILLCVQIVIFPILLLVLENLNKIKAKITSKFTSQENWEGSTDNFDKDEDVRAEEELVLSGKMEADTLIHCRRVRKVYPPDTDGISKIAIANLSFHVRKGECLGLLGPNGAGKTSTFRTVSGDLLPTYGECVVNGHSLLEDLDGVQRSIGVCPQFDALLDNLTVREHFVLYAHLKGIPRAEVTTVVDGLIERLDLKIHEKKQTCSLSGGNKRKVSLGIALIGNPPVILLDEPSTGMDPEAKRFMWNVIASLKANHAIVLTTHSMEEADCLCTRIAIMVDGRMRCLGSPQHLKKRFGSGYNLEFKVKSSGEPEEAVIKRVQIASDFFKNAFPSSVQVEQRRAQARFDLPGSDVSLAAVFEAVESRKATLGLTEYSISQTTLEQIFLFFGRRQAGLAGVQQADTVVVGEGGNKMDRILNILFATVGLGFLPALPKLGFGFILTLSVIMSPVGLRLIRWGIYCLLPFGRTFEPPVSRDKVPVGLNVLLGIYSIPWFPLSVFTGFLHCVVGLICCVSLVGIPFGFKHFKMAWRGLSYMVLGSPVDQDAGFVLKLYQYVAGFPPNREVDPSAFIIKRAFQRATGPERKSEVSRA